MDFAKLYNDVVFSGTFTLPDTWQDLDLSAYVGANAALCFLEVTNVDQTFGKYFCIKPKGYGGTPIQHQRVGIGVGSVNPKQAEYCYIMCMTNANGIAEISSDDNTTNWAVKLVGAVK